MKQISEEQQAALLAILRQHEHEWSTFKGVHHIDVGYKIVNGEPTCELAIRFHVNRKKQANKLAATQIIPPILEGIPTDVIQSNPGLEQDGADREARFDPLVGGIAVRNARRSGGGTLGAIVFDGETGAAMGLSNHHVLVGTIGRIGDNIMSPTAIRDQNIIGTLKRWNLNLDCSVFTLNGNRGVSTGIVDYPAGISGTGNALVGMSVTKSGRNTGTTFGIIDGVGTRKITIVPDPQRPSPHGEISSSGDSGSVWLQVDGLNAVGLHYAGEADSEPGEPRNPERAYAMIMQQVVNALHITFTALVDSIADEG